MFKKGTLSKKKPYQECKKFPYQGNLKRVQKAPYGDFTQNT